MIYILEIARDVKILMESNDMIHKEILIDIHSLITHNFYEM